MTPCEHHAGLEQTLNDIRRDVREISNSIHSGATNFATIELRLKSLEKIVYGAVALALIAVAGVVFQPVQKINYPKFDRTMTEVAK